MLPLSSRYYSKLQDKSPILQPTITVGGVAKGMEKKASSHRDYLYAMAFWWKRCELYVAAPELCFDLGIVMFRSLILTYFFVFAFDNEGQIF